MGILRVDHPDIEEFIDCKDDLTQINELQHLRRHDGRVHGGGRSRQGELRRSVEPAGRARSSKTSSTRNEDLLRQDRRGRVAHRRARRRSSSTRSTRQPRCRSSAIRGDEPVRRAAAAAVRRRATWARSTWSGSPLAERRAQRCARRLADGRPSPRTAARPASTGPIRVVRTAALPRQHDRGQQYPLPEIDKMSKGNRRIGLGVMGFADALVQARHRLRLRRRRSTSAEKVMEFGSTGTPGRPRASWPKSAASSPNWEGSDGTDARGETGTASATATRLQRTIAPTGTISIIAGCSGGIEPLFAVAFMRRQAGVDDARGQPGVRQDREGERLLLRRADGEDREGRAASAASRRCRRKWGECAPRASEISPERHVRMQAAFQGHTAMGDLQDHQPRPTRHRGGRAVGLRLAYDTGARGQRCTATARATPRSSPRARP